MGAFDLAPGAGHRVELSGAAGELGGPAELVLDNQAAAQTGYWTTSYWTGGGGYWHVGWIFNYSGTGSDSLTWRPEVAAAGRYKLYSRWSAHPNRASNAPYQVFHGGGETTVTADQRVNGGQWVYLGSFELAPEQNHRVILSDDADGVVVGDAIKLVLDTGAVPAAEILVDNDGPEAGTTGTWPTSAWLGGGRYRGQNYAYHASGTGANSFTWTPELPSSGRYRIYTRWASHATHASNAPYRVHHAGGTSTVVMDQRVNGGEWVSLGSFELAPGGGHKVVLTDATDGANVIADAVKFVRDAAALPGDEAVVDDQGPGAAASGSWVYNTWGDGGTLWGGSVFHNDPGALESFTWTPSLAAAGRYTLYTRWSAHPNRASDAPYTIHHAGGSTTVALNQQVNGGDWVLLGDFELAPGANHRVELTNQANGRVIADAVRFVPAPGRALVADAIKLVATAGPGADFTATASTLLREYITLEGRPLALIEGGQVLTVHPDHLGSPQKMTDSGGALAWDAQFRPFGEAHAITGTAANNQRFPGQLHDVETSFHYNYFRDYDPSLGRYVQSDPIGLGAGPNTYGYVEGNPVLYSDPFGLKTLQCKRPLGQRPSANQRNGPDVFGNPFYHQYSCVIDKNGNFECGGLGPKNGNMAFDEGAQPSSNVDFPGAGACELAQNDNECFENCLRREWARPRPNYSVVGFWGTNCQEYDDNAHGKCSRECFKERHPARGRSRR